MQDLRAHKRIFGEPLSLDECLEQAEEQEVRETLEFEGGDNAIIAAVNREMAEKVGEVIEVESDEDEDAEPVVSYTVTECLCCASGSKDPGPASSLEILIPHFHWSS